MAFWWPVRSTGIYSPNNPVNADAARSVLYKDQQARAGYWAAEQEEGRFGGNTRRSGGARLDPEEGFRVDNHWSRNLQGI